MNNETILEIEDKENIIKKDKKLINKEACRRSAKLEKKSNGYYSPTMDKAKAAKERKLGVSQEEKNINKKGKQPVAKKLDFENKYIKFNEAEVLEILEAQGIIITDEIRETAKSLADY